MRYSETIAHIDPSTFFIARKINTIGLAIFFVGMFVLRAFYATGAFFLLVGGVLAYFQSRKSLPIIARQWMGVLWLYTAGLIALKLNHATPLEYYRNLPIFLLAAFFVPGLFWARPTLSLFISVISIGMVIAGIVAFYIRVVLRALINQVGGQQHIQFSNITMMLGGVCLLAFFLMPKTNKQRWLALVGGISGVLAAFLGGGRGSWLMFPMLVVALIFSTQRGHRWRVFRIILTVSIIGVLILYFIPQSSVARRLAGLWSDWRQYQLGNGATSQGMRWDMWRCSLLMFEKFPWLGTGDIGLVNIKAALIQAGQCTPAILDFKHLHNDFIDTAVRRGIVGILLLIILYFFPIVYYLRSILYGFVNWNARFYAWSGLLVTLCFMVGGMTNLFFRHNIAELLFTIMQAWCLTGLSRETWYLSVDCSRYYLSSLKK